MAASTPEQRRRWREANPDRVRACQRKWREANKAKQAEYLLAWKAANPGRIAAYNIGYETAIKQATPRWADMARINAVYLTARELGLTVDHILPLRGRKVCGLHVESNLQLLSHAENASKGNAFDGRE